MGAIRSFFLLLARLALSSIFFLAVWQKLTNYDLTVEYMASKNMIAIPFFLYAAIAVELLGGLSLVLGYKARYGAVLLLIFLVPVTFIFHSFWGSDDFQKMYPEMVHFFSNVAIIGGLIYAASCGPGSFSIGGNCRCQD